MRLVQPSYFGIQAARLCQLLAVSKSEFGVRPLTLPVRALIAIFRCMARPASVRHCCSDAVEKLTHAPRAESGKLKRNNFCTVMEKEAGTVLLMLHNMFNTKLCHSNTRLCQTVLCMTPLRAALWIKDVHRRSCSSAST